MFLEDIFISLAVMATPGILPIIIGMDDEDLSFFTNNMKKYLEEICDIYAYSHQITQFQYLVLSQHQID